MTQLRLGFAGLGMAAGRLIPDIARLPFIKIVAAADLRDSALAHFRHEFGGETYTSVEEMCKSPNVDAVYVATPHEYHTEHSLVALRNRKHVIVEKPMALTVPDAVRMSETADEFGVKLMAGHTHSFDPPITRMREIVRGGELGKLLMISTSYYKDHIYRPFPNHDMLMSRGVVLNQGPHQVDIVRLIGGGMVKSVRAMAAVGDPSRLGEGNYACYLEFEDGTPASLVYSGYAYFDTAELTWGIREGGEAVEPDRHVKARQFFKKLGTVEERDQKLLERLEQWRYGGSEQGKWAQAAEERPEGQQKEQHQPFFGFTVVTCEKGDIRQSPDGLYVYTEDGRSEIRLDRGMEARDAELMELYEAVVHDRPVQHDGRWGAATLEVCLAILQSAKERREIPMQHQVPAP